MSKHTPGPWNVDYSGPARIAIVGAGDRILAFCNLQCEDGDMDEANARLIAAAPDMLEALEEFDQWATTFPALSKAAGFAILKARAAIAKVKGKS